MKNRVGPDGLTSAQRHRQTARYKETRARYNERVRERRKAQSKANYQKNKKQQYWQTVLRKYGVTEEGWMAIFERQGRACGLCRTTENKVQWHTDHCHETGRVRGILCTACNTTLGRLGDTAAKAEVAARRAVEYLRRHA